MPCHSAVNLMWTKMYLKWMKFLVIIVIIIISLIHYYFYYCAFFNSTERKRKWRRRRRWTQHSTESIQFIMRTLWCKTVAGKEVEKRKPFNTFQKNEQHRPSEQMNVKVPSELMKTSANHFHVFGVISGAVIAIRK